MSSKFIVAALSALSLVAFAETEDEATYRRQGGMLDTPKSFKGKVALIDAQSRLDHSIVSEIAATFAEGTHCNFVCEKSVRGDAAELRRKSGADVALVVIDDKDSPMLLLAPEDHWGTVNVGRVLDDGADAGKFKDRARKMVIKGMSILCGGGSSQFPQNIMNMATLKQLDEAVNSVPFDMIGYYQTYLEALGVTQREQVSYRRACSEGWAPSPTNDVQKKIWAKVHEIPKKPIRIKYDPKKGE